MRFEKYVLASAFGLTCLAGFAGSKAFVVPTAFAAGEETPKEIIAVQIRRQGFVCDNPQDAHRDTEASKPDEAVWVLRCDNASYRVRLIPDMAADVERIE